MPNVPVKTKSISKSLYKNYLEKVDEFLAAMRDAYLKENWNAVGLNALHATISANDALCVYYHGLRRTSEKHADAVRLLTSLFKEVEVKKNSNHLAWLINRKNLVEYEARLFTAKEAETATKHAERFISWVKSKLS